MNLALKKKSMLPRVLPAWLDVRSAISTDWSAWACTRRCPFAVRVADGCRRRLRLLAIHRNLSADWCPGRKGPKTNPYRLWVPIGLRQSQCSPPRLPTKCEWQSFHHSAIVYPTSLSRATVVTRNNNTNETIDFAQYCAQQRLPSAVHREWVARYRYVPRLASGPCRSRFIYKQSAARSSVAVFWPFAVQLR